MPAKKLTVCLLAIGLSLFSLFLFVSHSRADELDDINNQIKKLNDDLNSSVAATKPLESQLKSMQSQIDGIKSRVYAIEVDVAVKKKDIEKGYADLTQKEALLQQTVRSFYIKSYSNSPFLMFLSAKSASQVAQLMAYQQAKTDEDKTVITNLALSISSLEDRKAALEDEQSRLVAVKASLDVQSKKLDDVIQGAKAYQSTLTNQIAQLSAKQQELLAQKLGSLNIPQSAYTTQGGCVDDRNVDPGFSPRFALFTFGVPNRVGMNQYGAKGRAEAGQNAETILSAYYNADLNKSYDTGITITVNGTN
jgi:peptidoglycan hydrolase CwlO-like protein